MNISIAKNKNKGFTLTELIVVIVIIGVLAAVLVPSLVSYVNKARMSANYQEAMEVKRVMDLAIVEQQKLTISLIGDETLDVTLETYDDFESVDIKKFYEDNTGEALPEEVDVDVDGGMLYYRNRGIQIVVDLETMEYRATSAEVEED